MGSSDGGGGVQQCGLPARVRRLCAAAPDRGRDAFEAKSFWLRRLHLRPQQTAAAQGQEAGPAAGGPALGAPRHQLPLPQGARRGASLARDLTP